MPKLLAQGLSSCQDSGDLESLRYLLPGLLAGTMQAMTEAGRTVRDSADAVSWECTMVLARRVWDTARHVDIFMQLLAYVAGHSGEEPESPLQQRGADARMLEERLAGGNHDPAGLACDALAQLIELAHNIGDPVVARALDFVLADEGAPGRMGSAEPPALTAPAPQRLRQVPQCQPGSDA